MYTSKLVWDIFGPLSFALQAAVDTFTALVSHELIVIGSVSESRWSNLTIIFGLLKNFVNNFLKLRNRISGSLHSHAVLDISQRLPPPLAINSERLDQILGSLPDLLLRSRLMLDPIMSLVLRSRIDNHYVWSILLSFSRASQIPVSSQFSLIFLAIKVFLLFFDLRFHEFDIKAETLVKIVGLTSDVASYLFLSVLWDLFLL